jgi:hypothetical protein
MKNSILGGIKKEMNKKKKKNNNNYIEDIFYILHFNNYYTINYIYIFFIEIPLVINLFFIKISLICAEYILVIFTNAILQDYIETIRRQN